jgi:hypothetical protein
VDVLALAGTMVHHHEVSQLVVLHALLHVRLPLQHLLLHHCSQGKSKILFLKLTGHKFNFQRGVGPNQERRVHGGQHCHHHHRCYGARLQLHRTWVKNLPTFTGAPGHNSCSWDDAAYSCTTYYTVTRDHGWSSSNYEEIQETVTST